MLPVSPVPVAGRYRLDQLLAASQAGELWRGADIELSRPVVVKLGSLDLADDSAALESFRSEACSLGSLMHRGIPRIFDYGEPASVPGADRPFLVMEYVDGPSVAELLSRAPLEVGVVLDVVAQISGALAAAHDAGFVHAEISPRKIRLDRDSGAKLLECGNAYRPSSENAAAGIARDLYALGIVAYLCLGGVEPADGAALQPLPASIPAIVSELIADLTAEDPARRPASAADVAGRADALRKTLRNMPGTGGAQGVPGNGASAALAGSLLTARSWTSGDPGTEPLDAVVPRRRASIPLRTAVVAGTALVALAAFAAFRPAAAPAPVAASQPRLAVVEVLASKLIGLPVPVACARLHRLGLRTKVEWQPTSAVEPGRVTSVRPVGRVPVGHLITVIGSSRPSAGNGGQSGAGAHKKAQPPRPRRTRPATTPSTGPSPSPSATTPSPSPSPTGSPAPTSPAPTGTSSPAAPTAQPTATPSRGWLSALVRRLNLVARH